MTRLRWGLGAALALVALAAAASVLRIYVGHQLWLGGLAVLLLAAIDLVGFGSLARARHRLAGELAALEADPPGGALFGERRRRLEAIRAAGARPDADVLAAATAAAELGRAYLGKYLVAVTVLVGLVGTFAGLMETLRGVAPLLADERVTTLQALAAPLAGLDVTFGASLVGILVTLALALVQGDLALAEEEALARLEERTRHVLLPALWPAAEAPDERAVRELQALRADLASFANRAAEVAAERVSQVAAKAVDRMVREIQGAVAASVQAAAEATSRAAGASARSAESSALAADRAVAGISRAVDAWGAAREAEVAALQTRQAEAAARVEAALAELAREHAARLSEATGELAAALRSSLGGEGLRLGEASAALARAAGDLGGAARALGPPLGALAPELQALSREVALLAARSESEAPAATLEELVRLGEGVDRLEALLRLADGQPLRRESA